MKNQNNNRKKTHTTYSITNTHTHINIDKYTQKTDMNGTICFLKQFLCPNLDGTCISPLVSPERSLDSSKTTPKCPKTRTNLPFTPGFSQKGAWTAPKPPPTKKKKKIPKKKKKEFPKQFRTLRKPTISSKTGKPHCQCDSFYTCLHNEISCFLGQMGKRMVFWFFFCTKTADSISAQMREREMAAMTWPRRVRQKFQTCFPPWRFISPVSNSRITPNQNYSWRSGLQAKHVKHWKAYNQNKKSVESWWRLMTQLQMRPLFELFGLSLFLT